MTKVLSEKYTAVNAKLKGWRGIILVWAGTVLTFAESVFRIAGDLLNGGNPLITDWKGAAVVAVFLTIKNLITDVGKKT